MVVFVKTAALAKFAGDLRRAGGRQGALQNCVIAFAVIVILALGPASDGVAQTPLKLGVNDSWPPYSFQDSEHRPTGVFIDIIDQALGKRMGIPVELVSVPWARVQAYVRDRKVDGMITVPTRQRLEFLAASKNVFAISLNVYVSSASPYYAALGEVVDLQGLAPFAGCEINGNQSAIERYGQLNFNNLTLVTTYRQCFQMLVGHRVDFVVVPEALASRLIADLDRDTQFVRTPFQIAANHYLLLHKQSPHVKALPEFNLAIRKMREEGVLEAIATKYGVKSAGQK